MLFMYFEQYDILFMHFEFTWTSEIVGDWITCLKVYKV